MPSRVPRPDKRSLLRPLFRGYLTTLFVLATTSGRARAQERTLFNSDQIPRDLVVALMSYDGSSVPDILVGKAPPLLAPKLVVPPNSRVLGSQMSISQTTVVVDVPMAAAALRLAIDSGLVKLGWKQGPSYYGRGGGFLPAANRSPLAYCANGQSLTFSLMPEGLDATLLRYSITDAEDRCRIDLQQVKPMSFEFPTLVDPAGSDRSAPACRTMRTSSSGPTTGTALKTSLSLEEVLGAYGKQLADSGWFVVPTPAGDRTVESRWRQTRAGAGSRYATVKVTQPAAHPECRVMEMRLELEYSR